MEIDGNTIADQLVKEGSSHLLIELHPVLGISTKVNREVMEGLDEEKTYEALAVHTCIKPHYEILYKLKKAG
jgi:hypothetical protein